VETFDGARLASYASAQDDGDVSPEEIANIKIKTLSPVSEAENSKAVTGSMTIT